MHAKSSLTQTADTDTCKGVYLFPPRESFSKKVSFESRYGTCRGFPLPTSTNARITLPRMERDLKSMRECEATSISPKKKKSKGILVDGTGFLQALSSGLCAFLSLTSSQVNEA